MTHGDLQPRYVLDFDSTFARVESLERLADIALVDHPEREDTMAQLEKISDMGMCGELLFNESLRRRLALFQAHRGHVAQLTRELGGHISPTVLENEDWFRHNRERIYVVSGGFEEYIIPTVERVGVLATHVYANCFVYDADGAIQGFEEDRLVSQPRGKARQVAALGLPRPIVCVGDGSTDLEIKEAGAADVFWAFTAHSHHAKAVAGADRVITDFAALRVSESTQDGLVL